jgi:hypothetical protein
MGKSSAPPDGTEDVGAAWAVVPASAGMTGTGKSSAPRDCPEGAGCDVAFSGTGAGCFGAWFPCAAAVAASSAKTGKTSKPNALFFIELFSCRWHQRRGQATFLSCSKTDQTWVT